jgi:hypothetical protein
MVNDWTTTYCTQEEGFPKVLYATKVRLGILDRLENVGQEYVEEGTEYCEVPGDEALVCYRYRIPLD